MQELATTNGELPAAPTPGRYDDDLRCPDCDYALRGLTALNCPECGMDLGFVESEQSVIPWQRRRELGAVKAYWLTVWIMMFRWKIARQALYQPIDDRDASLFRGITIAIATASIWAMLWTVGAADIRGETNESLGEFALGLLRWPTIASIFIAIPIGLFLSTGMIGYAYDSKRHPEKRRMRIAALCQYFCASLACVPLTVIPNLIGASIHTQSQTAGTLILSISFSFVFLLWLSVLVQADRIRKWAIPGRWTRQWHDLLAVFPALFTLFGPLIGIPSAVLLIQIIIDTLR